MGKDELLCAAGKGSDLMAIEPRPWPDQMTLEANRRALLAELHRELRSYETRYELDSARVEAELEAGRLRETKEVAEWLIAYRLYQRLNGSSQSA